MERGTVMVMHSAIIGILSYMFMVFIMKNNSLVAEDRSVLLGSLVLAYMVLFGHSLPKNINKNIF